MLILSILYFMRITAHLYKIISKTSGSLKKFINNRGQPCFPPGSTAAVSLLFQHFLQISHRKCVSVSMSVKIKLFAIKDNSKLV